MNKYQKAFSNIKDLAMNNDYYQCDKGSYDNKTLDLIKELVDRTIPKKTKGKFSECRICKLMLVSRSSNYCPNCGQAIDWEGRYVQ